MRGFLRVGGKGLLVSKSGVGKPQTSGLTRQPQLRKVADLLALDTTLKGKPFTRGANDLLVKATQPSDGMACYAVTSTYST